MWVWFSLLTKINKLTINMIKKINKKLKRKIRMWNSEWVAHTMNNGHMRYATSPNVKTFIPTYTPCSYISRALHAVPSITKPSSVILILSTHSTTFKCSKFNYPNIDEPWILARSPLWSHGRKGQQGGKAGPRTPAVSTEAFDSKLGANGLLR